MDNAARDGHQDGRRAHVATTAGRVDAVMAAAWPDLSRSRIRRLIEAGHASLNGAAVQKPGASVEPGDRLALTVPAPVDPTAPVDFDLPILWEDDNLLAIDKPAGLAVHGAPGETGPTVAAWLLERYRLDPALFGVEHPGIVHRLDKDTSGVMVMALRPAAQTALSGVFESREAKKTYIAICDGTPSRERAAIEAPIGRDPVDRTRMTIIRGGRDSRTEYEMLGTDDERSLLVVRPETGRTHQIRVHLAGIGVPVTFDRVYGSAGAGRQQLHAWALEVPHPAGGRLALATPLPPDMAAMVRAIGLDSLALQYLAPSSAELLPADEDENSASEVE